MNQDLMVSFLEIIYLKKIIKDRAYIINLDEYSNVGAHWIALFCKKKNEIIYFDRFGVEYIPNEIKEFIEGFPRNKNIKTNIFRVQGDNSMCGYFCTGFIDFMLAGKKMTDYTNLFFPHDLKKTMI